MSDKTAEDIQNLLKEHGYDFDVVYNTTNPWNENHKYSTLIIKNYPIKERYRDNITAPDLNTLYTNIDNVIQGRK